MIVTVEDYLKEVKEHGTGPAKILALEEILMAGTLARAIQRKVPLAELPFAELQDDIFCLLFTHRSMVLAGYMMDRAEGTPLSSGEGHVVVPARVMEEGK